MCVDVQSRAWVAGFFGQSVTCWDMNTREMVDQIKVPAKGQTTYSPSSCSRGPNYD